MPRPDPPKHTRFKPGQSGNPGGKSKAQVRDERDAAEKALWIRNRLLDAVIGVFNEHPEKEGIKDSIEPNLLRLIEATLDRELGKAVQVNDHISSNGTMTPPSVINLVAKPIETKPIKDG